MSDPLSLPIESWRPQRHPGGLDPDIKRMALVAAGVAALLAVGVGGYRLAGRSPHAVPVIEADSRPLRVRPDNPGGLQLAGAEEQFMDGAGSAAEAMAPPPEAPAPQALRAQIKARQAAPEAAPPAEAPLPPPSRAVPLPVPPPPAPVAALPPPVAAAPVRPAAPPAGGVQVQLAAMDSEAGAVAEWQRLAKRVPDLLASRHPAVLRAERDGRTFYRLRTGGFADVAQATAFCAAVRAKGGACAIASF